MNLSYFDDKNILITGGCGFIGSHIIDKLMSIPVNQIIVIDDLSAGTTTEYLEQYGDRIIFYQENIRDDKIYDKISINVDIIIHLAAQPAVPYSVEHPYEDFDINVNASMKLLEFARNSRTGDFIFAASGGTVYGEAEQMPTPEFYPLRPISNYGAAKAAVEMYLKSYSSLYDMKTTSMRFGNVYGPRSGHGVMYDFYHKLKKYPEELEVLGNGLQEKSYLFIEDCVNGFIAAAARPSEGFLPVNMATTPPVSVNKIADLVSEAMGLDPQYLYTGGDRGWKGDVRKGELDTTLLQSLGWSQNIPIETGVKLYIDWLEQQSG